MRPAYGYGYRRDRKSDPAGLAAGVGALYPVPDVMAEPPAIVWRGSGTTGIASAVSIAKNSGKFRFLNAIATHASTYYQTTPSAGQAFVFEFETAAAKIDIRLLRFNSRFNVFVDNAPIQAAAFTTDAAGSADILALDFAGTAKEGTLKKIKLMGINVLFNGVYLSAGADAATPLVNRPIVALLGDSYTQGTGAAGVGQTYARWAFDALGYDFLPEGVGATGYLTAAGATAAATRMTDRIGVIPHAPSLIALLLGYNDSAGNMTTLATNHAATVAAANAAWPGVPVLTVGPWTPLGATASLTSVKNALIASAASNNSQFLDIEDIINAGNEATYTDADNVHPNVIGHTYLGQQIAIRGRAAGLLV